MASHPSTPLVFLSTPDKAAASAAASACARWKWFGDCTVLTVEPTDQRLLWAKNYALQSNSKWHPVCFLKPILGDLLVADGSADIVRSGFIYLDVDTYPTKALEPDFAATLVRCVAWGGDAIGAVPNHQNGLVSAKPNAGLLVFPPSSPGVGWDFLQREAQRQLSPSLDETAIMHFGYTKLPRQYNSCGQASLAKPEDYKIIHTMRTTFTPKALTAVVATVMTGALSACGVFQADPLTPEQAKAQAIVLKAEAAASSTELYAWLQVGICATLALLAVACGVFAYLTKSKGFALGAVAFLLAIPVVHLLMSSTIVAWIALGAIGLLAVFEVYTWYSSRWDGQTALPSAPKAAEQVKEAIGAVESAVKNG